MQTKVYNVGLLLLPEFALMTYCSASEPLRVANRLTKQALYSCKRYSINGDVVISSNGMICEVDGSINEITRPDMLVVCSSFNPQRNVSKQLNQFLKLMANRGIRIAGIDTGAYLMARAGILHNHRATIHWEDMQNFKQTFPQVKAVDSRYVIDGKRMTAAGSSATMDMTLKMIAQQHGNQLAARIAEQFIHSPEIETLDTVRQPIDKRLGVQHPIVLEAVSLMENHLEDTLTTTQIAQLCGISLRQLERLFHRYLNAPPGKWYRNLKLKNARIQLRQSHYSITEIAANNGFESASSFNRAYKAKYRSTPGQDRLF